MVEGAFPQKCNASSMKPGEREKLAARCAHFSPSPSAVNHRPLQIPMSANMTESAASAPSDARLDGMKFAPEFSEDTARPYRVCVWGGGRMGQLFAWIFAGSPSMYGNCGPDSEPWKRMQLHGVEVTICTSRTDLANVCVEKEGFLEALGCSSETIPVHESANPPSQGHSSSSSGGPENSFMLAKRSVEKFIDYPTSGVRRQVKVITREEARALGRMFDLVVIACHSGRTQEIGASSPLPRYCRTCAWKSLTFKRGTPVTLFCPSWECLRA